MGNQWACPPWAISGRGRRPGRVRLGRAPHGREMDRRPPQGAQHLGPQAPAPVSLSCPSEARENLVVVDVPTVAGAPRVADEGAGPVLRVGRGGGGRRVWRWGGARRSDSRAGSPCARHAPIQGKKSNAVAPIFSVG